jgi:hypothetical protein
MGWPDALLSEMTGGRQSGGGANLPLADGLRHRAERQRLDAEADRGSGLKEAEDGQPGEPVKDPKAVWHENPFVVGDAPLNGARGATGLNAVNYF